MEALGTKAAAPIDGPKVGYADRYDPDLHFDHWYTDATASQLVAYLAPGSLVLELGSATGRMTEAMCEAGCAVVGVEHSLGYIQRAQERKLNQASYELGDFEQGVKSAVSDETRRFDHVVVTNVVHEVHDVPALLAGCWRLLRPGAKVHVTLQNPESIHRLTGQALGLVDDLREITGQGRDLLTLRIYDVEELASLIVDAGFEIVARHGVMLKPFPNSEMARLSQEQLAGLVAVGPLFPRHCAMNYLVARRTDV